MDRETDSNGTVRIHGGDNRHILHEVRREDHGNIAEHRVAGVNHSGVERGVDRPLRGLFERRRLQRSAF